VNRLDQFAETNAAKIRHAAEPCHEPGHREPARRDWQSPHAARGGDVADRCIQFSHYAAPGAAILLFIASQVERTYARYIVSDQTDAILRATLPDFSAPAAYDQAARRRRAKIMIYAQIR
jgi:hypothetical protein